MDESHRFEIRYQPLHGSWPVLAFPCDANGCVPLDDMSERVRNDYFFARAVVGAGYAAPALARRDLH